jgi:sigma-E factor negative regulatory protein RseB
MLYVALFAMLALPQAAMSGQAARAWLDKMTHAVESLNYEGTFVFMRGDKVDTMHIIHARNEEGVRERLVSLTGEAREIIRDQGVLTCVWPHKNSVVVENARTQYGIATPIPADTEAFDNYYRFRVAGSDRIAGRRCRKIAIKPKDDLRYGHRLCIAEGSGILLRSVMLNPEGIPIEKVMFTSIRLRETIPDQRFEPTMIEEDYVWHRVDVRYQPSKLEPDPSWQIECVPTGFEMISNSKRVIAASPEPVQHMILTDGLASVSVFIANPQDPTSVFEGTTHSGALNAYARSVNDHQVTVVGEVPEETVRMIAQSIVYRPDRRASGDRRNYHR